MAKKQTNWLEKYLPSKEEDPEMLYKDRYNTPLSEKEQPLFNQWVSEESKKRRRDILMDKGTYDLQGFWKNDRTMDSDSHGSDKWKKPNHPTFSIESIYNGMNGNQAGSWGEDGSYYPSRQTRDLYKEEYYKQMFNREPNRPEHLNLNKSTNLSPSIYDDGGNITPARKWLEEDDSLTPQEKVLRAHANEPNFGQRMSDEAWSTINTIGSLTPAWSLFAANQAGRNIDKGKYMDAAIDAAMITAPLAISKGIKSIIPYFKDPSKINPLAFKPSEDMMYRGIGEEGYKDAVNSGVFRPHQNPVKNDIKTPSGRTFTLGKTFDKTYYTDKDHFHVLKDYNPSYIAEVPRNAAEFRARYGRRNDWSWLTEEQISVTQGKIYKKNWLQGYKEVTPKLADGGNLTAKQDVTRVVVPHTQRFNQEEYDYYHPVKEKGITSGDWKQDLLYNNQWLINAPVVGDQVKKKAEEVSRISEGNSQVVNITKNDSLYKAGALEPYTGTSGGYGEKRSIDLVDQYFNENNLEKSKYTPKSNYLPFLPSYSIKGNENFKNTIPDVLHDIISNSHNNTVVSDSAFNATYNKFLEDKNPIYSQRDYSSELMHLTGTNLGGHKTGLAWDKSVDLPYASISDAWDFEPNHYTKKWAYGDNPNNSPEVREEAERFRQLAKIQSTLMHKAGKPFKIYDRFYFDPKTKEYIPDDSIQSIKKKKGITPLQDEIMNKDYDKYFSLENGGQLTKLDQLTNFSSYDKSVKGGWLDKY